MTPNPLADELAGSRRTQPCILVIFGATGDLTRRKLVPSLVGLAQDGLLPPGFTIVGFARSERSDDEFRSDLLEGVRQHARGNSAAAFEEMAGSFRYFRGGYGDAESFAKLRAFLEQLDEARGTRGNRLFYLATPPDTYGSVLRQLEGAGMNHQDSERFVRVIVEKPFGRDLQSARDLNAMINAGFRERQVFRIDHYLGKETVQNILALRFGNAIFEPLWNERYVDHVQITVAESIGIGKRGGYFDNAGILRDMIQNHLLQVLTLVAMESPASIAPNTIRNEKVKVLQAIRTPTVEEVATSTVRGQYTAAWHEGELVPGYLGEEGVDADSTTETYAAVRLNIDNWRWAGTPFFLRSAKRMPRRVTEVAIHFKEPPHLLFPDSARADQNILLLHVQPDEGVSLRFASKVPGPAFSLRGVRMDFRYGTAFGGGSADAYERLLLDALIGDSTLFARRDEVEEAWRLVDGVVEGWRQNNMKPSPYEAGSWGPEDAGRILGPGREWRKP